MAFLNRAQYLTPQVRKSLKITTTSKCDGNARMKGNRERITIFAEPQKKRVLPNALSG